MLLRNRFLGGGISFRPFYDAEGGTGGGTTTTTTTTADTTTTGTVKDPAATTTTAPTLGADGKPVAAATTAADGKTTAKTGTIAGGTETTAASTAATKAPPNFPDNWRQLLAGDDKAQLAQLERMGSPADIWKSFRELQAKVSSGELKALPKPPAKDAKPEEIAAYRKEQGIPDAPDGYKIELANGMVIGEADKPLVDGYLKYAHTEGMTPAQVNQNLNWYYQMQDAVMAQTIERDETFHTDSVVALKQEWGPEYKPNVNAITSVLNFFPEAVRSQIENARTPDGQKLGDMPDFNRTLLHFAKQINPASTLLPAAAGAGISGVEARIAEIEGIMRDPVKSDQYWKGESGAKMQGELRGLYDARETMKKRQNAA